MIPGTIARPRPPFVVAANGPKAMALAARYGQGWATYGPSLDIDGPGSAADQERWWAGLAEMVERFDEVADAFGRSVTKWLSLDGAPIFSLVSLETAVEGIERAAALGFDEVVVHRPRSSGVYAGSLAAYAALGDRLASLRGASVG
jgi:alkanesulfonate monooxygenase SsuD/methylene tetrahydromethanopterin reductase-like flavin-dependent oxidoreductase (luciferase family)